jgi:hypothetical protein
MVRDPSQVTGLKKDVGIDLNKVHLNPALLLPPQVRHHVEQVLTPA